MSSGSKSITFSVYTGDSNIYLVVDNEGNTPKLNIQYDLDIRVHEAYNQLGLVSRLIGKTLPPDNIIIESHYKGETVKNLLKEKARKKIAEDYNGLEISDENIKIDYSSDAYNVDEMLVSLDEVIHNLIGEAPLVLRDLINKDYNISPEIENLYLEINDKHSAFLRNGQVLNFKVKSEDKVKLSLGDLSFYTNPHMSNTITLHRGKIRDSKNFSYIPEAYLDIIIEEENDSTPAGVVDKLDKEFMSWLKKDDSHIKLCEYLLYDPKNVDTDWDLMKYYLPGALKVRAHAKDKVTLEKSAESVRKMIKHLGNIGLKYRLIDPNEQETSIDENI